MLGILIELRNREHTSTDLEMPDVRSASLFLCLPSPVEWSPTTYAPYGGAYYTRQEEGTSHFDTAYSTRGSASLFRGFPRLRQGPQGGSGSGLGGTDPDPGDGAARAPGRRRRRRSRADRQRQDGRLRHTADRGHRPEGPGHTGARARAHAGARRAGRVRDLEPFALRAGSPARAVRGHEHKPPDQDAQEPLGLGRRGHAGAHPGPPEPG